MDDLERSDAPHERPRRRWPWWARWGVYLGIFLVVIVTLAVVTLYALIGAAEERLVAEVAKLEAAGESLDPADYAPPEVPRDENRAAIYSRMVSAIRAAASVLPDDEIDVLLDERRAWSEEEIQRIGAWIDACWPAWDLLRELDACSGCRFPTDYAQGIEAVVSEQKGLRSLVRALGFRVRWLTESGYPVEAAEVICRQVRMAADVAEGPSIIDQLVRVAVWDRLLLGLESTAHSLEAPGLESVLDKLVEERAYEGFRRAFAHERACFHRFIGDVIAGRRDYSSAFGYDEFSLPGPIGRLVLTAGGANYLRLMTVTCDEASGEPNDTTRDKAMWEINDRLGRAGAWKGILCYDYIVPSLAVVAVGKVLRLADLREARRRAACCAVALRIHRLREGEDPEDPAAYCRERLGEDLVRDPYTGNDLVFDLGPDRILVYSLGPNGIDDGGVHDKNDPDGGPDIPFVIGPLPEAHEEESGE